MLPVAEVSDYAPAISGLVGVLVGGLITYMIEARRDRRAEKRRVEAEAKEATAVARMTYADLDRAAIGIASARAHGKWIEPPNPLYFTEATRDEARLLASHLSPGAWTALRRARNDAALISGAFETYRGQNLDVASFDVVLAHDRVLNGMQALRPLAGLKAPVSLEEMLDADELDLGAEVEPPR